MWKHRPSLVLRISLSQTKQTGTWLSKLWLSKKAKANSRTCNYQPQFYEVCSAFLKYVNKKKLFCLLRQLFLNPLMRHVDLYPHLVSFCGRKHNENTWITSEDEKSSVDGWFKWSVLSCAVLSPPGGVPCQAEEGADCWGSRLVSSALQSAQPASQGETEREGKSRGLLLIF